MEKEYRLYQKIILVIIIILLIIGAIFAILDFYTLLPKKTYTASDFNIKTLISKVDYDNDGIDDYRDLLLGARIDAENHPTYVSKYYEETPYPPDYEGVCTDVIWRAFKNAGYSFRSMINKDIEKNIKDYKEITEPDLNIDFRRVYNQRVFFEKYAIKLTNDLDKIEEWQPGDIVFIKQNHVGIISDKRNKNGIPYIIHNSGQPVREEDFLWKREVTGHYRFDASLIDEDVLVPWDSEEELYGNN